MKRDSDHAAVTLRRIAAPCVALMFAVVVASAFLRHFGASDALQATWAQELAWVRHLHRVTATLVLLGAVAMVLLARRAHDRAALVHAGGLLAAALLLSAVGVAAGASRAAPVVLINLFGGFAMLALCARLTAPGAPVAPQDVTRAAGWLLACVALQAAGGAWASAQASAECVGLSDCAAPALLHRVSGLVLGYALLLFGLWARLRGQRPLGMAMALAALLLLLLGMLTAGTGRPAMPAAVVLHNAFAAVAVVILARLVSTAISDRSLVAARRCRPARCRT